MNRDGHVASFAEIEGFLDLLLSLAVLLSLLIAICAVPNVVWLRALFGIPLVAFLPGYLATTIAWPRSKPDAPGGLGWLDRLWYSLGLNIVVMLAILLALASYGRLSMASLLAALTAFTLLAVAASLAARLRVEPGERLAINLRGALGLGERGSGAFIAACVAIMAVTGGVAAYIIVTPSHDAYYSKLYLLDASGGISGLPTNLSAGEAGRVVVNVGCMEDGGAGYELFVRCANSTTAAAQPTAEPASVESWDVTIALNETYCSVRAIALERGDDWNDTFSFRISEPGLYLLDFKLVPDIGSDEYENHIWITVV